MSSIADLESEKEWYYEKISEAKAQIKKLENNHDSLSLFKNDATKSSESFYSINLKIVIFQILRNLKEELNVQR